MKLTKKLVPSEHYKAGQRQLREMLDLPGQTRARATVIEKALEAEFVRKWGFSRDVGRHAERLREMAARACRGFDHCRYYYDAATMANVVVSQPYIETG